jgi:TatD DNase family protein
MKYIDIHCHLDFPDYSVGIGAVLERMKKTGVGAITIGTDLESSKRAIKIAEENENVWACIGVHPIQEKDGLKHIEKSEYEDFDEKGFSGLAKSKKVVAIGECGLDWFRVPEEKMKEEIKRQTTLFENQINFALKHNKPLMLHCRNSYDEVLDILEVCKREAGEKLRGNAHFFAGDIPQAKRFLDLGFTLSFTGVITFTNDYNEVIKFLPRESIMSETDSPFVAPVPYRGQINEPVFVVEVVKKLSALKDIEESQMREILLSNAKRVFGILQN